MSSSWKRLLTSKYTIIIASIIVLDQILKFISRIVAPLRMFPFLNIASAQNSGIAFGVLDHLGSANLIFLIISLIAIACMFYLFSSDQLGQKSRLGVTIMIGGAIANLIDRFLHGYVIDFIDFHVGAWHFATFNLADAAISIGALIVIIFLFKEEREMAVQKIGKKPTQMRSKRKHRTHHKM